MVKNLFLLGLGLYIIANNSIAESNSPATLKTTVTFGPSVSVATKSAIVKVASVLEEGVIGSPITIYEQTPNFESTILALNAKGEIVLSSMANGPSTVLSINSTAIAMVRMLLGSLPAGIAPSKANQIIENTKEFQTLNKVITETINTGGSTVGSDLIMQSLQIVLSQASQSIAALISPTPSTNISPSIAKLAPVVAELNQTKTVKDCDSGQLQQCLNEAKFQYKNNNFTEALKLYKQACDGGNMDGCSGQGACEYRLGNNQAAKNLLTKACNGKIIKACEVLKSISVNVQSSDTKSSLGNLSK